MIEEKPNTRLNQQSAPAAAPAVPSAGQSAPVAAQKKKRAQFEPYHSREDLDSKIDPECAPRIDKKGKVQAPGKSKYFLARTGDTFKLIAVYRNGKGIARRGVRTLKPYKKSNPEDKAVMRQLFSMGIPGAVQIK